MNAINIWSNVGGDSPDEGALAAWVLGKHALDKGDYTTARRIVANCSQLAMNTLGREIMARAMQMEGKEEEAAKLYSAIEIESAEAKMFLARRAISRKNWKEARRLTQLLLLQYPDTKLLQAQLQAIGTEQQLATK